MDVLGRNAPEKITIPKEDLDKLRHLPPVLVDIFQKALLAALDAIPDNYIVHVRIIEGGMVMLVHFETIVKPSPEEARKMLAAPPDSPTPEATAAESPSPNPPQQTQARNSALHSTIKGSNAIRKTQTGGSEQVAKKLGGVASASSSVKREEVPTASATATATATAAQGSASNANSTGRPPRPFDKENVIRIYSEMSARIVHFAHATLQMPTATFTNQQLFEMCIVLRHCIKHILVFAETFRIRLDLNSRRMLLQRNVRDVDTPVPLRILNGPVMGSKQQGSS